MAAKRGTKPGAKAVAAPPAVAPSRKGIGIGRTRLRVALALALALMLVGLASTEGAVLLQRALRTPSADDIAQRICTAYQTENYSLLVNQIDPATIPPNVTTPWDAQAQAALADQLHTEDAALGKVTRCSYSALTVTGGQQAATLRQYHFLLQRAKLYSTAMNLKRQSDGSWLIARDNDFLGVPVGS